MPIHKVGPDRDRASRWFHFHTCLNCGARWECLRLDCWEYPRGVSKDLNGLVYDEGPYCEHAPETRELVSVWQCDECGAEYEEPGGEARERCDECGGPVEHDYDYLTAGH